MLKHFFIIIMFVFAGESSAVSWEECGSLQNSYGPFDYRTEKDKLKIVEDYHFTPEVERLIKGKSGPLGSDIDYTLRAFPNHYKALLAMMRLVQSEKRDPPRGAKYTMECYFERALQFREDDHHVRMLYGIYLVKKGNKSKALFHLDKISDIMEDSLSHYNLGLAYFDLAEYDKAYKHAKLAYDLGINLAGLKKKLQAAGKWKEGFE